MMTRVTKPMHRLFNLTFTRSSSSEELTQAWTDRKSSFSARMASFWELSWGCSRARNTRAPMMRYSTTRKKMADTVFHLMTVVRVSYSSSWEYRRAGFVEKDRRGLEKWAADFGSRRSGAATVKADRLIVIGGPAISPRIVHHFYSLSQPPDVTKNINSNGSRGQCFSIWGQLVYMCNYA